MSFFNRAASLAAVITCAASILSATTPSFAQDFPDVTINALTLPQVPMTPASPARDLPSEAVIEPAVVEMQEIPASAPEEVRTFASLRDAVAAQDGAMSDREIRCLAAGVYFESKGEPLAGQLAVAQTILNRTRSGRFPRSICSVLTQAGQFSFVRGGVVPSAEGRGGWTTAVAIAKVAHADLWDGAADQALYFHARRVAPGWRMQKVAAIGNHVFYR